MQDGGLVVGKSKRRGPYTAATDNKIEQEASFIFL